MSETPLWAGEELADAAGGTWDGGPPATAIGGFSIDTRELGPGDVFVALKSNRDGHDFVTAAFEAGAAAALVAAGYERKPGDGALLRVSETLEALEKIGKASRARLPDSARVVAVTGSAGKTTTKEMLRAMFEAIAPGRVHASVKSFNNHWGVPLTLARMPRETAFGVFEIGMNHAGEIGPLSRMVRPHVAVVTTIAAAHLGNFNSLEEIAEAKAEIFEGLEPGGFAILPRDAPHFVVLARAASRATGELLADILGHTAARVMSFGESPDADTIIDKVELATERSRAMLLLGRHDGCHIEVGVPGRHNVANATAAVCAWFAADGPRLTADNSVVRGEAYRGYKAALEALADLKLEPAGRGQVTRIGDITLIDESYNANPASMAAALKTMALYPRREIEATAFSPKRRSRRVAVLGDMLELGDDSNRLHGELAAPIAEAGIDLVHCCGPHMAALHTILPDATRGAYFEEASDALAACVVAGLEPGDVVMVKASNGSRLGPVVAAIRSHLQEKQAG